MIYLDDRRSSNARAGKAIELFNAPMQQIGWSRVLEATRALADRTAGNDMALRTAADIMAREIDHVPAAFRTSECFRGHSA